MFNLKASWEPNNILCTEGRETEWKLWKGAEIKRVYAIRGQKSEGKYKKTKQNIAKFVHVYYKHIYISTHIEYVNLLSEYVNLTSKSKWRDKHPQVPIDWFAYIAREVLLKAIQSWKAGSTWWMELAFLQARNNE